MLSSVFNFAIFLSSKDKYVHKKEKQWTLFYLSAFCTQFFCTYLWSLTDEIFDWFQCDMFGDTLRHFCCFRDQHYLSHTMLIWLFLSLFIVLKSMHSLTNLIHWYYVNWWYKMNFARKKKKLIVWFCNHWLLSWILRKI